VADPRLDPFSLIPEEEKDDLIKDVLNLDPITSLPEESVKDEMSLVDLFSFGPGFGTGPFSLKPEVVMAMPKAFVTSVKSAPSKFAEYWNNQEVRRENVRFAQQTGQTKAPTYGVGFGEGAASRLLFEREAEARKNAETEFDNLPAFEKQEIVNNYINFLEENTEEYNEIQQRIRNIQKEAKLTKTEKALSSGFDSLFMMTPAILATLGTKNPSFMYGMLPVFGHYEQASSYRQAVMSGLSHQEAVQVSNLNALSEVGTELLPLPFVTKTMKKYWKTNGSNVQTFARDGFTTASLELIGENINTVFQETNLALSGVNTDLAFALANKDNPSYEGPSWVDVMLDNAYMTSIATLVGAGGMVSMQGAAAFSPEIKRTLNELDPNIARRLAREIEITAKQVNANYKAIDDTFLWMQAGKEFGVSRSFLRKETEEGVPLDQRTVDEFIAPPREYYNFVMPEILPDEYLASQMVRNNIYAEELTQEEIDLANSLQAEIGELEGLDLVTILTEGRKVLNILNLPEALDPQTFDAEIQKRVNEYDAQIEATTDETKLQQLKTDQKTLKDFLAKKQKPQAPLAQKIFKPEFGEDITLEEGEAKRKADIGANKIFIDERLQEPSSPSAIESVKQNIVLPKKFNKANLATFEDSDNFGINFQDKKYDAPVEDYGRTYSGVGDMPSIRDFNDVEVNAVSEVINNLIEMGLPKQAFEGIPFMGIHSNMQEFEMQENTAYGQYFPAASDKYITLAASQIPQQFVTQETAADFSNINQNDFNLGSLAELQSTLAHEIGHHIDFGFVQFKQQSAQQEPLSASSALFEPIDFGFEFLNILKKNNKQSIDELTVEELKDYKFETGGSVMQEMFSLYIKNRDSNSPYSGQLFSYPFDRYLIDTYKNFPTLDKSALVSRQDRIDLSAEVFAQMIGINYTNPKLLDNYPNSKKLLQDINNVFINNEISQIGIGLRDAFQSDRSDADSKIYTKRLTREQAQEQFGYEPTSERMGEPPVKRDRDNIRLPVQESNYVAIGELKPDKNNLYAGAPRTAPGQFKNTQKDFDSLVNKLVKMAEQKDISLLDESRHWYRNINQEIDSLVAGDPVLKENVLRMLTIYSSQTPVETNLAYTLRSLVSLAKGKDPQPGFQPLAGEYAKKAMAAQDFGQKLDGVGFKLQSFYENLTGKNPNAVTMDTWMFKMLGFEKGQSAIANHRYGTAVIQKATEVFNQNNNENLTPMEMQAVLWTWVRNKELVDQGKTPEYIGYETYLDKASAIVTGEVIPTEQLSEFAFAEKLNARQKAKLTRELLDVITTSEGKNKILDALPGTGLYKFSHSFGAYDGKINPNILTSLILEKVEGAQQFSALDLTYADDFLRAWGYVFRQEAMPYFVSNENISEADAYDVNNESVNVGSYIKFIDTKSNTPFEISGILRRQLKTAFEKVGIDGFTQMGQDSISAINFKFQGNVIENFNQKVEEALGSVGIDGVGFAVEHDIKYNTQYLTNNWSEDTDGQGYIQGRLEEGSILKRLDGIRAEVDEVLYKYRNEVQPEGANPTLPSTGLEPGAAKRPLAKKIVLPKDKLDKIDEAIDGTPPTTPPAPPGGVDPNGKFTPQEIGTWANFIEAANIKIANKFGRLWTIEEDIIKQFGVNGVINRLIEAGIDPNSKDWRVTTQTDIFSGRAKDNLRDIREDFYIPMLEFLTEKNISEEEFNHFIYNLHAPERNTYLPTLFEEKLLLAQAELKEVEASETASKQDLANARRKLTVIQKKMTKAEKGSGIHTEDAIATLKKYGVIFDMNTMKARGSLTKGKNLLKAYEEFLKPMIDNTRRIYIDSGLIPEETVLDWDARYNYYVPLVGFAEDTLIDPETGREIQRPRSSNQRINTQMTVSGSLVKKATGRESEASSPLQQSVIQATAAAIEAEKNRVTKSLADLARAFPSDLWEVSEDVGQVKKVDATWDPVKGKSRVGFKENGVQKYVEIYDSRLAQGFDNFDSTVTSAGMKAMRAVTRYLSMVNTSLDPTFMINNFMRDVQTGYFNLMAEEQMEGGRAEALEISKKYYTTKNILTNAITLVRFEKSRSLNKEDIKMELDSIAREGVDITPEVIKQVEEKYQLTPEQVRKEILARNFKKFGGETGYIEQRTMDQLTQEFQDLQDMYAGKFKGTAKQGMKNVLGVIERMNVGIENAARFTAFEGYVESMGGIENATPAVYERAAALAKNLTINFNRMGTMGPTINAAYMFFNASIQGTVNLFRGLTPNNISSRKAKAAGGLAMIGATTALYNILFSEEDEDGRLYYEKIPDWEKQTKYIIMFPEVQFIDGEVKIENWGSGSKYKVIGKDGREYPIGLGIPMPYGYAIFANTGRVTTELAMAKLLDNYDKSVAKAGIDLGESFLHNFAPLSVALPDKKTDKPVLVELAPTFAPSAIRPVAELMVNRNFFGSKIYYEPMFNSTDPKSYRESSKVLDFIEGTTRSLNDATGGNEFYSGTQDWDPAVIQHLLDAAGGGVFRTGRRGYNLLFSYDRPTDRQTLVKRRFIAGVDDGADYEFFQENLSKVERIENAYRKLSESLDPSEDPEQFLERLGYDDSNIRSIKEVGNFLNKEATRLYGNNSILSGVEKSIQALRKQQQEAKELYKESDPEYYHNEYDRIELEILSEMKRFNKAFMEATKSQSQ
jgi:hypothetical protein